MSTLTPSQSTADPYAMDISAHAMAMGKPEKSSSLKCEDAVMAAGHKPMKSATVPIRKQPVDTVPAKDTWKRSARTDLWD